MTDRSTSTQPSTFSLIRLKAHCKIAPTRVDFTPTRLPVPTSAPQRAHVPCITPVYNNDQQHFTPAFTLPADQVPLPPLRNTTQKTVFSSETNSKTNCARQHPCTSNSTARRRPRTCTSPPPTPTTASYARISSRTTTSTPTPMRTDSA